MSLDNGLLLEAESFARIMETADAKEALAPSSRSDNQDSRTSRRRIGEVMALNLAVLLNESAQRNADRTAIITGGGRLTYGELNAAANKVANALRSLGIQRGDKVAVMLPNVPEFPIIYYGILKLGAAVVLMSDALAADAVRLHLDDCHAVAVFAWEDCVEEGAAESHCRRAPGT